MDAMLDRPLTEAEIEALRHWPRYAHTSRTEVDTGVLVPLLGELLDGLPWWDRSWRVTSAGHADPVDMTRIDVVPDPVEVAVPGTVGRAGGEELPLSARIRIHGDRLVRFEAKVGDLVIGPGREPAGKPERHRFGVVLTALMKSHGISRPEMARRCGLAQSTIAAAMGGRRPHERVITLVAAQVGMTAEDLTALAD
ncbi:helix-turn-helix domain-containing protein [Actinoplanes flavus]|uniref:Helix-turn-helix transcriptional regulator n=1 Tax=Actinoplanes flavus TaxID=2820290 RepID=A0ABS3UF71_9ACTN|nr:helix-turn-helix domain-containing protein [Actinoplanes flavus]MBO3737422.1 helix-turn-helix transcriptional regulator [Actinoplanes flavus]